jgi:hypothetical protein
MYYRDPKCVYVADTIGLAHTIVGCLSAQGIRAEVMNEMTLGGFEGLTALLPGKLSLRGLEVWVIDPADVGRARQMLAEWDAEASAKARRPGTVEATCEECGAVATFQATEQGTIQNCLQCGAMLDVPDPDDDWDVGEPEGEAEE